MSLTGHHKAWILCAITLFCIFVPRSLSFLPFVFGLIGYAAVSWNERKLFALDRNLAAFFAAIIGLLALSAIWSINPESSLDRAVSTGGLFVAGLLLFAYARTQTFYKGAAWNVLLCAYGLIGLYFWIESKYDFIFTSALTGKTFQLWNFNRAIVVYAILFIPLIFVIGKLFQDRTRAYVYMAALTACMLPTFTQTGSQTAQIIFIGSISAYILLLIIKSTQMRRIIFNLSAVGICAAILLSPLIPAGIAKATGTTFDNTHFSYNANLPKRLEIWNFVVDHIQEKPLIGNGVEATRHFESAETMPLNNATSFLHPHNAYLQIWVETGLLGALMACAFAVFLILRIKEADPQKQPLYFAVLTGFLAMICSGYGFWQSWHIGLLLAVSGLCILITRIPAPQKP